MKFFKKHLVPIAVFSLLIIMFLLMFFSAKGDSNIVDEIAHIPSGVSYVTKGDYRLNPEHPPLIKDLAALPLVIAGYPFPSAMWEANNPVINNQWEMGWTYLYKIGNDPDTLTLLARLPIMLLSLLFGYFVFRWAKELFGTKAGIVALTLYVFNANVIAHSRFVTTDLGISFALFVAMYTLYRFVQKPTNLNLFIAGLGFGLTLITKFSAAVLAPTFIIVYALLLIRKGKENKVRFFERINDKSFKRRLYSGFLAFLSIAFIGIAMMWLFYIPHTINMPAEVQKGLIEESLPGDTGIAKMSRSILLPMADNPVTKPLGQWFLGFFMVTSHVEGGHDAYLWGQVSNQGWWYYYPFTLLIKTAIPLFILLILTIVFWRKLAKKDWFTEAYLWVLPVVLMAMGIQGKLCLGVRYMLPLYAFMFLFIARIAGVLDLKKLKNLLKPLPLVVIFLLVWYILEGLLIYPHYLAYYNQFAGGYKNGYKYLTDSNTDWGQDIKRLKEYVDDQGIDHIYVDVFPGGFEAKHYLGDKMTEWHVQNGRPTGYFALSATFYQNSRLKKDSNGGVDYSWLDNIEPVENIGGSILIYDLK
jgi:hypothetical protein